MGTGLSHLIELTFSPLCLYKPHGQMLGPDATNFFSAVVCFTFMEICFLTLLHRYIYILLYHLFFVIFLLFYFISLYYMLSQRLPDLVRLYKSWAIWQKKKFLKAFQHYIIHHDKYWMQPADQWCCIHKISEKLNLIILLFNLCSTKMINIERYSEFQGFFSFLF